MDAQGNIKPTSQELWINARMTHFYSISSILGLPQSEQMVEHGLSALKHIFKNPKTGGYKSNAQGEERLEAYSHAFVILSLSSALTAGFDSMDELKSALKIFEDHFLSNYGISYESFDSGFIKPENYFGANSNMHMIEALLSVSAEFKRRGLSYEKYLGYAKGIVFKLVEIAQENNWRIIEHFTYDLKPDLNYNEHEKAHPFRPYGVTPGHGLEWSRLCLLLRGMLDSKTHTKECDYLLFAAKNLFLRAVSDGWICEDDRDLGFIYTTDYDGAMIVQARMHWVLCEALAASRALHLVTGNDDYEAYYRRFFAFLNEHFLDSDSYIHELSPDLKRASGTWSGKPDVYHGATWIITSLYPLSASSAVSAFLGTKE